MNKNKKRAIVAFVFLLVVAGIAFYSYLSTKSGKISPQIAPTPISSSNVRLEIFSPTVLVQYFGSSEWEEASQDQEIPQGSKIKTQEYAQAQLVYPNGSVTRLDSNTEITLSEFSHSPFIAKVFLEKGKIWSRIAKLLGSESYQTESKNLVTTIRGTSYGHETSPEGDKIISSEKEIEGKCVNETQTGIVREGKKANFSCEETELEIEDLTPEDIEDEWYQFNEEKDEELDEKLDEEADHKKEVLGTGDKSPTPSPTSSLTPSSTPTPTSLTPTSTPTLTPTPTTWEEGVDRQGFDYRTISEKGYTAKQCQGACSKEEKCKAWTYVEPDTFQGPNPVCWLKEKIPQASRNKNCVSGVKE